MTTVSIDVVLILLPALLGYATSAMCPISANAGKSVLWRPPAWVFGLIWPILYILTGSSWYLAQKRSKKTGMVNFFMVLLMFCLNYWMYIYACRNDKIQGVYVLMASVLVTFLLYTSMEDCLECKMLIAPLLVWIIIALMMSAGEIQARYMQ